MKKCPLRLNLPLDIEIPVTSGERKLGLMFRESLNYNSGMFYRIVF